MSESILETLTEWTGLRGQGRGKHLEVAQQGPEILREVELEAIGEASPREGPAETQGSRP